MVQGSPERRNWIRLRRTKYAYVPLLGNLCVLATLTHTDLGWHTAHRL